MRSQKLVLDFIGTVRLARRMDDAKREMIVRLCAEAGALMEDVSVVALTIARSAPEERTRAIQEIAASIDQMQRLAAAAAVLSSLNA